MLFRAIWQRLTQVEQKPPGPKPGSERRSLLSEFRSEGLAERAPPQREGEFEAALNRALGEHGDVVAGRVNMIGLEKIREHLGPDWARASAEVHQIARTIIERRITNQDVYSRNGETDYVIVFARLTKQQAQLKTVLISQEITKRILGESVAQNFLEVKTASLKEDGKLLFQGVPSFDKVLNFVNDAPALEALSPAWERGSGEERMDELAEEEPEAAYDIRKVEFIFRPLWFVSREVISSYLCMPAMGTPSGALITGYDVLLPPPDPDLVEELDMRILERGVLELRRTQAKKLAGLVAIPVHFETLSLGRRRMAYVARCKELLPRLKARLVFEIVGLPAGIPQSRLADFTATLKPWSRAIMGRCSLQQLDFKIFKDSGVFAVGADINGPVKSEAQVMLAMGGFVERANGAGLQTYLHGIPSISLIAAAIASGFEYIDGQPVTSLADVSLEIQPFKLKDLYATLRDGV